MKKNEGIFVEISPNSRASIMRCQRTLNKANNRHMKKEDYGTLGFLQGNNQITTYELIELAIKRMMRDFHIMEILMPEERKS